MHGEHARPKGRSWVKRRGKRHHWQRHLRTFGSLTAASQVESALSFVTTAMLVRLFGSTETGQVLLAQSMATVWFVLWDPRFEDALQRFVPAEQLRSPGRGTRLYCRLVRLDIVAGLLATILGVALAVAAATVGWISAEQLSLLVPAVMAAGAATPSGSASAGFAIAGQLSRLGVIRLALSGVGCLVTLTALLVTGPVGYLVATVITGLVSTVTLTVSASRQVHRVCGAPCENSIPMPPGLLPFLVKSSATGSVAAASDSGLSLVAGLLGGPTLVTYLKIAAAPGRLFAGFLSPVPAQLYPRLAMAGAEGRRGAVMRDVLRASALTGGIGVIAVVTAASLLSLFLGLVYGPEYTMLSASAVVMLAGAALRGTVIWAKVLPPALGFPGVRLIFLAVEGACQLGWLITVTQIWTGPSRMTLAFAWGSLGLLAFSTIAWFVVLRFLTRSVFNSSTRAIPPRKEQTIGIAP
ncbi:hypothetical protein [Streptomyces sp. DG1A-41]|uniref:lipopolysaccharide biosynthesis protein n=1 Tax=Streptomyces sp. DG1A-41 TaxID=3125779 RepID=UPI0030D41317